MFIEELPVIKYIGSRGFDDSFHHVFPRHIFRGVDVTPCLELYSIVLLDLMIL